MTLLGLSLALASAAALNWGYIAQHDAASALPPLRITQPVRSLRMLAGHLRWLAGFVAGLGGWGLYVGALAFAPLSIVQATSAGGLGLLAVLAWKGKRPATAEATGVAVALLGLALLAGSLAAGVPHSGRGSPSVIAVWIGASAVAAGLAALGRWRFVGPGAGLGAAAGLLYSAGDVATKAALPGGGRLAFVPVILACHGLAFVALQLGFQRGGAIATAGVATLLTNALPIAAGTVLYGEHLPSGPLGALRLIAFAAVLAAAVLLARTGEPPPTRPRRSLSPSAPAADTPSGAARAFP